MSQFAELLKVNVNEHVEKKGNLSYLSWPYAIAELLKRDENAEWEYLEPKHYGDTLMVGVTVGAFGRRRTCWLPVMDYKNKAIANPDAFAVNTAMQRCLVKAIAMHGLGLYIYAGEDLPPNDDGNAAAKAAPKPAEPDATGKKILESCGSLAALQISWKELTPAQRATLVEVKDACKKKIAEAEADAQAA